MQRHDIGLRQQLGQRSEALQTLGAEILRVQAQGDVNAARAYVAQYGKESASLQADIVALELEKIPVDIRFNYER